MCGISKVTYTCGHEGRSYLITCPPAKARSADRSDGDIDWCDESGRAAWDTAAGRPCPACGGPAVEYDVEKEPGEVQQLSHWELADRVRRREQRKVLIEEKRRKREEERKKGEEERKK